MFVSFVPIVTLIVLLIIGGRIFGGDLTSGASQIALIFSSIVAIFISIAFLKRPWKEIEKGILEQLSNTGPAIFILLMIGSLTATWMLSGVVPTIIYYGLKIINPSIFLVVTFLLTALVSVLSGSSWTTVGTIGVAMISAGSIIGISTGWLAGAIISGAYFGDKRSPLSDSCNLSVTAAGADLYKHLHYLLYTNLPSFIISFIVFAIVGFTSPVGHIDVDAQLNSISSAFNISPWLLLIPCFTLVLIFKKVPAYITLFISALIGGIVAFFVQPDIVGQICDPSNGKFHQFFQSVFQMMSTSTHIETSDAMLNTLTTTKGMSGMLNTIWLILCVVAFGGILDGTGMIDTITQKMIKIMNSTFSIVASTIGACVFCNIILSDQYMAILIPGKMFAKTYKDKGYAPELLSRSLEDSGTVTSVLVPWNTCGVVQSTVLGVPTLTYLPYCIFNIASPFVSLIVAALNWKIKRIVTENNN